ncbi:hypothetical protein SPBR_04120 [Sporothrix brasiliensis 5110]|uniref:Uncharacterized protein n=1 Tax=Sporothrix brasiliensis 5110 TaxID=1398154 RepID=A0A0C2FQU7_9PEZI|nr:uncharacterized protein SPBR_04120 [Sporothrix brasiliensis 5110]KIH93418.1 hypothetical protein SPBR_04120 [Sporothrix brasiliensis 5110]
MADTNARSRPDDDWSEAGEKLLSTIEAFVRETPMTASNDIAELLVSKVTSGTGLLKSKGLKVKTIKAKRKRREGDEDDYDNTDDTDGSYSPDTDSEEPDTDEEVQKDHVFGAQDKSKILEFLGSLTPLIAAKYGDPVSIAALSKEIETSIISPGSHLFKHQTVATHAMSEARKTLFKGLILADPPGLGKTLPTLMAIAMSERVGRGPCVIIAPNSCCLQWINEAKKFLAKPLKVLLLLDDDVNPVELFKYDLVVTSYNKVSAEFRRLNNYRSRLKTFRAKDNLPLPKRPVVTLLSGFFNPRDKRFGEFLVLDEAHYIKNPRTSVHQAVAELRESFDTCLLLSGTPFDNTWRDGYALLRFLKGHPFSTNAKYINTFSQYKNKAKQRQRAPDGEFMLRLIQLFGACMLRRSNALLKKLLTSVKYVPVKFELDKEELKQSNSYYEDFQTINRMLKRSRKAGGRTVVARPGKKSKTKKEQSRLALSKLVKAQQAACHKSLPKVYHIEHKISEQTSGDAAGPQAVVKLDEDDRAKLKAWLSEMRTNDNWRSPRVSAILKTVETHQATDPTDAIIIFDESVLFLSIVEIALKATQPGTNLFTYDGRLDVTERAAALQSFKEATDPKILLMSRSSGGVGLNVQFANVVVQSCPWWKASWLDQAVGRVNRPGQKKPVFVYQVIADKCDIENHKLVQSEKKSAISSAILDAITKDEPDPDAEDQVIV